MANRHMSVRALGTIAVIGVLGLGTTLTACSISEGTPASPSNSAPPSSSVTIMLDGHSHTIASGIECTTTTSQTDATPAESGNQTTKIRAKDDAASVSVSVSDETPPAVNGFALSLKAGNDDYQMPYQTVQSPNQVEVNRQGKTFTLTGTGQAGAPGQAVTRKLHFGIHIVCP